MMIEVISARKGGTITSRVHYSFIILAVSTIWLALKLFNY